VNKEEVERLNIMAVPTAYLNGEEFGGGRMTVEEILAKLGSGPDASELADKDPFDVLIVGGGPGGASAAIYAARKGIRTGIEIGRASCRERVEGSKIADRGNRNRELTELYRAWQQVGAAW